jgi:acetolactate synthase I/II/III large subunit
MKVHAALAAVLADHGVTTMFGLVGDGNVFFVDSFKADEGGRYIAAAHEASVILMAAGYAFSSRQVGVATVTHGPGLANTLGTLYGAVRERAPIVLIVADTPVARRGHVQKANQSAMVMPTGAIFDQALSPQSSAADLARALRKAALERRPVVFNVPADFNFEEVQYARAPTEAIDGVQAVAPDPAAMDVAVGMLASIKRPIVLAGMGASWSQSADSLKRLARALGGLLATTLPAKGMFAGDAHDIGVFGTLSSERAVNAIMASDGIVAVGASLNEYTGGAPDSPYFSGKRVLQCDISPVAFGAWHPPDVAVVADARAFADTAVACLEEAGHRPSTFHRAYSAKRSDSGQSQYGSRSDFVNLTESIEVLNKALPVDRAITVDGGRFMKAPVNLLEVPKPEQWAFSPRGFGAIGNSLATAIGLACANPTMPSVAVTGDGGFMLGGLTEFNTAVRHGIDLIVVVCNDGCYGAEYEKLKARGYDERMSFLSWPDLAPVADALGGSGFTVRNSTDLQQMVKVIADRDRPVLIDLKLDPTAATV